LIYRIPFLPHAHPHLANNSNPMFRGWIRGKKKGEREFVIKILQNTNHQNTTSPARNTGPPSTTEWTSHSTNRPPSLHACEYHDRRHSPTGHRMMFLLEWLSPIDRLRMHWFYHPRKWTAGPLPRGGSL